MRRRVATRRSVSGRGHTRTVQQAAVTHGRTQARGATAARMRGMMSGQWRDGWHGRGVEGATSGAGGLAVARAACTTGMGACKREARRLRECVARRQASGAMVGMGVV